MGKLWNSRSGAILRTIKSTLGVIGAVSFPSVLSNREIHEISKLFGVQGGSAEQPRSLQNVKRNIYSISIDIYFIKLD